LEEDFQVKVEIKVNARKVNTKKKKKTRELWIQIEEMHKISISMGNRPVDLSKLSSTSKLIKKILSKLAKKSRDKKSKFTKSFS
jgi:hypothetical protein